MSSVDFTHIMEDKKGSKKAQTDLPEEERMDVAREESRELKKMECVAQDDQ